MVRSARTSKRSEEHTSELQSRLHLVCRLLLEKKKTTTATMTVCTTRPRVTSIEGRSRPVAFHPMRTSLASNMPASTVASHFFFFNDTATTEIYTLSLHDALPISRPASGVSRPAHEAGQTPGGEGPRRKWFAQRGPRRDRKSTRLNSSHGYISYAVFCLKKKKQQQQP